MRLSSGTVAALKSILKSGFTAGYAAAVPKEKRAPDFDNEIERAWRLSDFRVMVEELWDKLG